jgi:phosphatidate cytidylyltransferase
VSAGGGRPRPRREPPSARRSRRAGARNARSDLGARVLVAIPAALVAILVNAAGGIVWTLALLAIGSLCLHELYELLRATRPIKLVGFIALGGLLVAAQYGTQFHIVLAAVAVVPLLFLLTATGPARDQHATLAMASTLFGVYWIGFALAHAVLLRELPHGDAIVIDVLVGTFVGDTGAYLGGRTFGSRPLAPRISPNKTVEGLAIGMITAIAAVFIAGLYQDWLSSGQALLLGIAVAIAAPIGDLFESFVKRDIGIKDTGRAFGAHGGALDRADAALFAVVVSYYVWYALG